MIRLGIEKIPIQLITGMYMVPVCSKAVWDMLRECERTGNYDTVGGMLLEGVPLDISEQQLLCMAYIESLKKIREETGLEVPYYPVKKESDDIKYTVYTTVDKMVADYSGLDIYAVDGIPILDYWLLERDAFISALSKTKDGRKYLNNAYRLTCEDADEDLEM